MPVSYNELKKIFVGPKPADFEFGRFLRSTAAIRQTSMVRKNSLRKAVCTIRPRPRIVPKPALGYAASRPSRQGTSVYYIVESSKSFYEATFDLAPTIQRLGFVILASHDLGEMLQGKDIDLDEECRIVDIGNYRYLEKLLAIDIRLSLALPWRIAVFTEKGATQIGLIRPDALPALLGHNAEVDRVMAEIEEKLVMIVDEVR